ncbi:hypothetical protein HWV62_13946 [Athelia sp. TMB]|nr:hypothetical protein HWV62_13946 [Athelia sp. TMB]
MSKGMHRKAAAHRGSSAAPLTVETTPTVKVSPEVERIVSDAKHKDKISTNDKSPFRKMEESAKSKPKSSTNVCTEDNLVRTSYDAPFFCCESIQPTVSPTCLAPSGCYTDRFGNQHNLNEQKPTAPPATVIGVVDSSNSLVGMGEPSAQLERRATNYELLALEKLRPKQTTDICSVFLEKGHCFWEILCIRVHPEGARETISPDTLSSRLDGVAFNGTTLTPSPFNADQQEGSVAVGPKAICASAPNPKPTHMLSFDTIPSLKDSSQPKPLAGTSSDPVAAIINRVTSGPELPASSGGICKKSIRNCCKSGDLCPRFHPSTESSSAAVNREVTPAPTPTSSRTYVETLVPLAFTSAAAQPIKQAGANLSMQNPELRAESEDTEICINFTKNKCSRGVKCPRKHRTVDKDGTSTIAVSPPCPQSATTAPQEKPNATDLGAATGPTDDAPAPLLDANSEIPVVDEANSGSSQEPAPPTSIDPALMNTLPAAIVTDSQNFPKKGRGKKKKGPQEAIVTPTQESKMPNPQQQLLEQQIALAVVNLPRRSRSPSITTQPDDPLLVTHFKEDSFSADSQASDRSAVSVSTFATGESSQSSVSPDQSPVSAMDLWKWQRSRRQRGSQGNGHANHARNDGHPEKPCPQVSGSGPQPPISKNDDCLKCIMQIPCSSHANNALGPKPISSFASSSALFAPLALPAPPGLPPRVLSRPSGPPLRSTPISSTSATKVAQPNSSAPLPPPPPPPPARVTVTVLEHTKVSLGPGFEVQAITTGFESRWLILGNVSHQVKEKTILRTLKTFGQVEDLRIPAVSNTPTITVRALFATPAEAMQAAGALNGAQLWQHRLTARLPINNTASGNGTLKDSSVWLEWEVPGRLGFAGYASQTEAEAVVQAANGCIIRDSYIAAAIHEGIPTLGAANVRFVGLPPDVEEKDLEQFGEAEAVMLGRPNYASLAHATKCIQGLLDEFGEVVGFEVYPAPYRNGYVKAWAHFPSPSIAQTASQHLDGRRPLFLGKGRLSARHIHALSYSLPFAVYETLASDISWLRRSFWMRNHGAALSVVDHRNKRMRGDVTIPVHVKLAAEDVKELGRLKSEFELLLHGEKLMQNGKVVWDGFFSRPEGVAFIQELERRNPGVQIQQAVGRRTITLFGPLWKRRNVHRALLERVERVRARRVRSIPLTGRAIGFFMSTDLMNLSRTLGHDNVILNVERLTLSIRGDDAAFDAAQRAVRDALKRLPGERGTCGADMCPVCFTEVVSPIRLQCGHSWCKACFANYLLASVDNKAFPLRCLGDEAKCSQTVSVTAARNVLSADDFDAVADAAFHSYVYARPDEFHYCPTPNCPQIYRTAPPDTILQCPACLARICPSCHTLAHDGISCIDRDIDGDKLFKEWMGGHDVKTCPGCKASIERIAGCNHMTCTRCQTHICWECLHTFPKGEGIYQHMRAEHGGIGLL